MSFRRSTAEFSLSLFYKLLLVSFVQISCSGGAPSSDRATSNIAQAKAEEEEEGSESDGSETDSETESTEAYPVMSADPSQVCATVTYKNRLGEIKVGRRLCEVPADCSLNGEKNCMTTADYPAVDLPGLIASNLSKIHSNLTVFELEGEMPDCSENAQTSCYAGIGVTAVDPSTIDSSKILSGYSVLGVEGSLGECSNSVVQGCYVSTARKAAPACSDGGSNCFVPAYSSGSQSLKAIDLAEISAGILKKDFVLGGITGQYPSASYPLSPGDAYSDLTLANFNAQMKSASNFAWFDSAGIRYSRTGDTDITANSILSGTSIFGTSGSLQIPSAWDVRVGELVGTETGKLKVACRNGYNLSTFDIGMPKLISSVDAGANTFTLVDHGFSTNDEVRVSFSSAPAPLSATTDYFIIKQDDDTFSLASSSGGAAIDITTAGSDITVFLWEDGSAGVQDAIDDQNNNSQDLISQTVFSEDTLCDGLEASTDDENVWRDLTSGGCDALADDCVFEDKISGLQWTEASSSSSHWGLSLNYCANLTFAGQSDWRLPTQKEWMTAQLHGIRSVNNSFWMNNTTSAVSFWSASTASSSSSAESWLAIPSSGSFATDGRESPYSVSCVRP